MNFVTEKTAAQLNMILDEIKTEQMIRPTEPIIYIDVDSLGDCDINSKSNFMVSDWESVIIVAEGEEEIFNMIDHAPFSRSELVDFLEVTKKI